MRIIREQVHTETTAKNSRFISLMYSVHNQEEAKDRIKEEWDLYPDATHIVYAYRLGKTGDIFGMSDDGEPHGTAGRPVFEVLKGSDITNVILLVVRYFGGTKLGTGGLVKAYTRAAQEVLSLCRTEELTEKVRFFLELPYPLHEPARKALIENGAGIEEEDFTTEVRLSGTLPKAAVPQTRRTLRDLSSGTLLLEIQDQDA